MQTGFVQLEAEYRVQEFQSEDYEILGERTTHRGFTPLQMEVLTHSALKSYSKQSQKSSKTEKGDDKKLVDAAAVLLEKEQAFQNGYEAGVIEGKKQIEEEAAQAKQKIINHHQEIIKAIKKQAEILFVNIEKKAVMLSLEVSKKILLTTASIKPEYIHEIIRSSLIAVGANQPLRIRMSHEDYEFISVVGLPAEFSKEETGVEYVADDTIKSGCVVETNFGEIDLQLEKMWQEVKDRLFEVYK